MIILGMAWLLAKSMEHTSGDTSFPCGERRNVPAASPYFGRRKETKNGLQ